YLPFTTQRLEDLEFYPYKKLFNEGLASIMVAHLNVPSIEPTENYPTSLSYNVITNIVKNEMGYDGLIFTDALNMKGASNYMQPGEIDLEAFLAGNDVLLFAENVPLAIEKFKEAYANHVLSEQRLAYSVKKILAYKYRAGLNKYKPIDLNHLYSDLNDYAYDDLNYQLYENAVTVFKNEDNILPVRSLENEKIAYIKMGDADNDDFVEKLQAYADVTILEEESLPLYKEKLKDITKVIIGFHKADGAWKNHNFKQEELNWIQAIANERPVILAAFVKPYALMQIKDFSNIKSVVLAYQNNTIA